jgi:peptidoglycan/xylan/chitin deacetylase (PgdA/CDA1 family)
LGQITSRARLYDEIAGSGEALADLIHRPIRFFAFPYGQPANLSCDALEVAHEAGYQAVCTAYGGYNRPGGDPFQIQRVHGDPDMIRFQNWMTVDPRKWQLHPPYAAAPSKPPTTVREA